MTCPRCGSDTKVKQTYRRGHHVTEYSCADCGWCNLPE